MAAEEGKTPACTPAETSGAAVLTVDELASLLRVNRDTAYRAVRAGEIPGVRRIGKTIRISRDAVLEWLRGESRAVHSKGKP